MKNLQQIIKDSLSRAISYDAYREMISQLLEKGETTGLIQNEDMVKYTILNVQRMNKWDKYFTPDPEIINNLSAGEPHIWLVISEAWCGDAAHILPILNHLSKNSRSIELKIVLRDKNPVLMDNFLSNGSRSIPIVINLRKSDLEVMGVWGSRPIAAQNVVNEGKAAGLTHDEYISALQIWYSRNRGADIQREIAEKMMTSVI